MNVQKVFKAGQGAGKSGSFFFFSYDNRLMIKTISVEEEKTLKNMVKYVNEHITGNEGQSLIAKVYGLYTIRSKQFAPVSFMLMQNTVQYE